MKLKIIGDASGEGVESCLMSYNLYLVIVTCSAPQLVASWWKYQNSVSYGAAWQVSLWASFVTFARKSLRRWVNNCDSWHFSLAVDLFVVNKLIWVKALFLIFDLAHLNFAKWCSYYGTRRASMIPEAKVDSQSLRNSLTSYKRWWAELTSYT